MRKVICCLLLSWLFLNPAFAGQYDFAQKDIDQFLSFADAYIKEAREQIKNAETLSLEKIFYRQDEKWQVATNDFLKKYGWDNKKMNDFLYIIRNTYDYIMLSLDAPLYLEEEVEKMGRELPEGMIELVQKNVAALERYFPVNELLEEPE